MWIVMTSCAAMPQSCKGTYRNVALVKVLYYDYNRGWRPCRIDERINGVLKVRHMGHHNVGTTKRCAYQRALKQAEAAAEELNNAAPLAEGDLLMSYGSA